MSERDERAPPRRHPDTTLVHGRRRRVWEGGATLPPVVHSTAFAHESAEAMEAVFAGREPGFVYSRLQNPSVQALEERVTDICDARGTLAVASGMSAVTLGLLGLLKAGDELIAARNLFSGTYTLFTRTLADLGVTVHLIDPRRPEQAAALINERTRGIYLEAIANPTTVVPDLAAYRALCDAHGLPLLLDATLITPALLDPQTQGADLAFFSASKYVAGAASSIGGLVVDTGRFDWLRSPRFDLRDYRPAGEHAFLAKLRARLMADVGPTMAPMTAFLMVTGLETLALRFDRQCENALAVARWLREQKAVQAVYYPGLPDSPHHELARRQYHGRFGSLLSFSLANKAAAFAALNRLALVQRSTNLGDTRSLAVHPASTIYGTFWPHEQADVGVDEGLIRLSVGIEHAPDVIADLEQAIGGPGTG